MGDEKYRELKRRADASGEPGDEAAAAREAFRRGRGVLAHLETLIGKSVFIEGVRIDYRGKLISVFYHPDGYPGGLLLEKGAERVSYFDRGGPNESYTYICDHDAFIPYEMVHEINEGSFEGWQKK